VTTGAALSGSGAGRGGLPHAVVSDVGLTRTNNEDAYLAAPPLFAVADGMGGHQAGEVASAEAIETVATQAGRDRDSLVAAVHAANDAVYARASANPALAGMGTTITAMVAGADSVQIVHVGDSRAYLLREGRLRRLTQDHTVVDRLAREGKIAPDEVDRHPQRSVLERALGVAPDVDVDVQLIDVHPGDRLLLCTDGLTSMLDDGEIRAVLLAERDPQTAVQQLVDGALEAGGKDNVTVLIVDIPRHRGGPDPDATAEQPAVPVDVPLPPPPRRLAPGVTGSPGVTGTPGLAGPGSPGAAGKANRSDPASAADLAPVATPPVSGAAGPAVAGRGSFAPAAARRGAAASTVEPPPPPQGRARRKSHGYGTRPAGARPAGARLLIVTAVVVPLAVIALLGGWFALHNSWYVGESAGDVAVFRGVPGSFAGIHVSSLAERTTLAVADLPQVYQSEVRQGLKANGKADAQRIVTNLRRYAQAPTPAPAPGLPAAPGGAVTPTATALGGQTP
jgi:serine/threonine protein phosphatase PrpC